MKPNRNESQNLQPVTNNEPIMQPMYDTTNGGLSTAAAIVIKKLELRIGQMELEMLQMKKKFQTLEREVVTLRCENKNKNFEEQPVDFDSDHNRRSEAFDSSRIISKTQFTYLQKQEFVQKILSDVRCESWEMVMCETGTWFDEHGYTGFKKAVGEREGSLVLIRTNDNEVFGGYASVKWPYTNSWVDDPEVFLFHYDHGKSESWEKIVSREGSTKMKIYNGPQKHTLYFGRWEGCWIDVENNGIRSYNFGNGKKAFQIKDIEVYCCKN